MSMTARLMPEQHAPPWQRITVVGVYLAALICLVILIVFTIGFYDSRSANEDQIRVDAQQKSSSAVAAINDVVTTIEDDITELVERLDSGEIKEWAFPGLGTQINLKMVGARFVRRMGAFYAPFETQELYAPNVQRPSDDPFASLTILRDPLNYFASPSVGDTGYDDPNRYKIPFEQGSAWGAPFRNPSDGMSIVEF